MPHALQLRGVRKRFLAGVAGCLATADVLRGVDLDVDAGESLAVVGPPGAGKSTLLLCAAGLLSCDSGSASWFGDSRPLSGATRAHYCLSMADLASSPKADEPRVWLADLPPMLGMNSVFAEWIASQCDRGSAVVVTARDERFVLRAVDRVLTLAGGVLHSTRVPRSRVAETVPSEASPFC